MLLSTLLLSN